MLIFAPTLTSEDLDGVGGIVAKVAESNHGLMRQESTRAKQRASLPNQRLVERVSCHSRLGSCVTALVKHLMVLTAGAVGEWGGGHAVGLAA